MSSLKIVLLSLSFSIIFSLPAQNLLNKKGNIVAIFEESGMLKDANQDTIGQFMSDGVIKDANGDIIGSIDGDNFKDMNGDIIGSINEQGEVFDVNKMKIGEIPTNTIIKNNVGKELGRASSAIDKKRLAAYHFFFFNSII